MALFDTIKRALFTAVFVEHVAPHVLKTDRTRGADLPDSAERKAEVARPPVAWWLGASAEAKEAMRTELRAKLGRPGHPDGADWRWQKRIADHRRKLAVLKEQLAEHLAKPRPTFYDGQSAFDAWARDDQHLRLEVLRQETLLRDMRALARIDSRRTLVAAVRALWPHATAAERKRFEKLAKHMQLDEC